jgi:4'-phosphopantetheinyl transferase
MSAAAWRVGPLCPPPLADEAHVWRVELAPVAVLDRELPADERERGARIRSERNRGRWLAARWALRLVLGRYLARDPAQIELQLGAHGKPALAASAPPLRFNLSHSGELALIALARERDLGVDVEEIDRGRDLLELARVGLEPDAAAAVRAAPEAERAGVFYAAWVRREAIAKCLGVGLGAPLPSVPVTVATLDPGPAHAAAIAVAGETLPSLRRFRLDDLDA